MNKIYIKYGLIFFGIVCLIDISVGVILKSNFKKIEFGTYGTINSSLKESADILILGSSRALHHYDSNVISTKTGISCYNTGLGGYGIFYNYAILSETIKKKSPRIVILDLSPNVIVDDQSYNKLNTLLPYYKSHNSFKEIIELDSKFSKLELVSSMYRYNSILYDLIRDNFVNKTNINNGFIPLLEVMNVNGFKASSLEMKEIDPNKLRYLEKIIDLCSNNGIKLIGVISPTYLKYDLQNTIIQDLQKIFVSKDLEFYDYSDFSDLYKKPQYFKDQLHLNNVGAKIFTNDLSRKLILNDLINLK